MSAHAILLAAREARVAGGARHVHTASAALACLRAEPAQLGIFGLSLPDGDGLDLIATVLSERLCARCLVVSTRSDEHTRHELRPGRIHGFFDSASEDFACLPEAIRRVAEGGTYFSPSVVVARAALRSAALSQLLTLREFAVLGVLGSGHDDQQAALILHRSEHTIHDHRVRIMRKLGVQTRSELMIAAIQRGVVRITPRGIFHPGAGREHLGAPFGTYEQTTTPGAVGRLRKQARIARLTRKQSLQLAERAVA